MKTISWFLAVVVTAMAVLSVNMTAAQTTATHFLGSDTAAAVMNPEPGSIATLTGRLLAGTIVYPPGDAWAPDGASAGRKMPVRYTYLHLDRPVDLLRDDDNTIHQYDIEVFAINSKVAATLNHLVGHKVTVNGYFPRGDGSATGVPFAAQMIVRWVKDGGK